MIRVVLLLVLGLALLPLSAKAMPDEYLQKDYENCMGGQSEQQVPDRAQYCVCVRDGLRQWTIDDYGAIATEAQQKQGQANAPVPVQVAALAKSCIDKILH
jgi:hypothetical protein